LIDHKKSPTLSLNKVRLEQISPIPIIDTNVTEQLAGQKKPADDTLHPVDNNNNGGPMVPSLIFLKKYSILDQNDPNLEKATEELYSLEFYKGSMNKETAYSGLAVSSAKEKVKKDLLESNKATVFYEMTNKPVYCRCGTVCYVKILDNQWFLNYGNDKWKSLAFDCLNQMEVIPSDIVGEFKNVFDWLKERACARKSGLGTNLPWDPNWIVESLSDSVIYMVYYIVAKYVNTGHLEEFGKLIDDSFFDYVFYDKRMGLFENVKEVANNYTEPNLDLPAGDNKPAPLNLSISTSTLTSTAYGDSLSIKEKETEGETEKIGLKAENGHNYATAEKFLKLSFQIKKEFEYYYPLDSRHSGRDLVPNHLSFFIFNHAIMFPRRQWPKQIVVNGSVLMEGKKMSKSMGNIIPLRKAIRDYSADSIRVAMLVLGELLQDVDFSIFTISSIEKTRLPLKQVMLKAWSRNLLVLTNWKWRTNGCLQR
jgi:leucyl-tRNA synthetase